MRPVKQVLALLFAAGLTLTVAGCHCGEKYCEKDEAEFAKNKANRAHWKCADCGRDKCDGHCKKSEPPCPPPKPPPPPPPPPRECAVTDGVSGSGKTGMKVTGTMHLLPGGEMRVEDCDGKRIAVGTWTGEPLTAEATFPVTLEWMVSGSVKLSVDQPCDPNGVPIKWTSPSYPPADPAK